MGLKRGRSETLNHPVMEALAIEVTLLRTAVSALTAEVSKAERRAEHWHAQYLAMIREKLG